MSSRCTPSHRRKCVDALLADWIRWRTRSRPTAALRWPVYWTRMPIHSLPWASRPLATWQLCPMCRQSLLTRIFPSRLVAPIWRRGYWLPETRHPTRDSQLIPIPNANHIVLTPKIPVENRITTTAQNERSAANGMINVAPALNASAIPMRNRPPNRSAIMPPGICVIMYPQK